MIPLNHPSRPIRAIEIASELLGRPARHPGCRDSYGVRALAAYALWEVGYGPWIDIAMAVYGRAIHTTAITGAGRATSMPESAKAVKMLREYIEETEGESDGTEVWTVIGQLTERVKKLEKATT